MLVVRRTDVETACSAVQNVGILLPVAGLRVGVCRSNYGAQNEAYMSRSAEKWVRGLCFNELGVCG